jgi:cyclohexadieny/prephenate dehydrogenase
MLFDQITIVGVGLIGGSVGLAAKARGVAGRVIGVDRDPNVIAKAVAVGAIDAGEELAEAVAGAGLVVVCAPVDHIAEVILTAAPHAKPGTLFTDAGSTKVKIVSALRGKMPAGIEYIPAHPLAGSEKAGPENGRADLFEGRVTALVVNNSNVVWERTVAVGRFWEALGSRVVLMNADEHDKVLAVTSHLPHAVAAAVAGSTPKDWLNLAATGFRDVTRIAAGDPQLWAAIFEANRDATLAALATFADRMNEFRTLLEAGDRAGLVKWLTEGKQVRDALGT